MLGFLFLFFCSSIHIIHGANSGRFPKLPGTWVYEGSLIDPMNGQTIARLVGLELFQAIDSTESSPKKNECYLSRKVFCYVDSNNQLLQFYRRRYNGPKRTIPVSQSIITSESIVRYGSGGRYIATEFDTGKSVSGKIESDAAAGTLKVYTRPTSTVAARRGTIRNEDDFPEDQVDTVIGTTSPRRLSLIQFGSTGAQQQHGVRETYDYRNHGQVLYTRYGEGPVWYGPNRMTQIELTGTHYEEPYQVPIPSALEEHIPKDFWEPPDIEKVLGGSFMKYGKKMEKSWLTRLRSATQFTVGGRHGL